MEEAIQEEAKLQVVQVIGVGCKITREQLDWNKILHCAPPT